MGNWVVKKEIVHWQNVHYHQNIPMCLTHTHTRKHSPIVALGLVLRPSMLGPSSGTGSHGQEMFTCNDNDVLMHYWCAMHNTHKCW